ncbi:GTP cyclohydrolase FolE2 [Lentibacillus sediminis]|uniref:GTP cyclohydrolase FolE2 n=1 Tax=Lentibacillus sediminis TaxID=1940529 RepID=UPI000C1B8FE8|nr:GTP cyclohydrolase FolE2 [Lentibacillus sediminis]
MEKTTAFPQKQLPDKAARHKLFGSVTPPKKTKPVEKADMADLQNTRKDFLFDIDAVGVANVKHPITVNSHLHPKTQTTVGTITFTSSLKNTSKGINMSRFTQQLQASHKDGFTADISSLKQFTKVLAERLKQNDATITVAFPWFYERKGPATGQAGMNHADVTLTVTYDKEEGYAIEASLSALITTLCPCSKEISEYSAHNQRGSVKIEVSLDEVFDEQEMDWKEQLLEAAESNASARIHPVLKRPDEKMVTEQAYENPRFVEDLVRLVAADLYEMPFVNKFHVHCQNEESIHMHDAVASIHYDKRNEQE